MHGDTNSLKPESAVVYFTNESLDEADVYAVSSSSMRTRIGTVMPGRTEALPIPDVALGSGDVSVAARLLARTGFVDTGPFMLYPGDRYDIRLPADGHSLLILPSRRGDAALGARARP